MAEPQISGFSATSWVLVLYDPVVGCRFSFGVRIRIGSQPVAVPYRSFAVRHPHHVRSFIFKVVEVSLETAEILFVFSHLSHPVLPRVQLLP